jgi:hypothetical protein
VLYVLTGVAAAKALLSLAFGSFVLPERDLSKSEHRVPPRSQTGMPTTGY